MSKTFREIFHYNFLEDKKLTTLTKMQKGYPGRS